MHYTKVVFLCLILLFNCQDLAPNFIPDTTPPSIPSVDGLSITNDRRPVWTWDIPADAVDMRYSWMVEHG